MNSLNDTQKELLRQTVIEALIPADVEVVGSIVVFEYESHQAIGILIAGEKCYLGRCLESASFTAAQCDWYVLTNGIEVDVDWFEERVHLGPEWKSREGMLRFEERRQRLLINTEHTSDEPNLTSGWDDLDKQNTDIYRRLRSILYQANGEHLQIDVVTLPGQCGYWIHDLTFDLYRCVDVSIEDAYLTIKLQASKTASSEQAALPALLCRFLCDENFMVTSITVFNNDAVVIELSRNAATGKFNLGNFSFKSCF